MKVNSRIRNVPTTLRTSLRLQICKISYFYDGDYRNCSLPGRDAVQSGRSVSSFLRILPLPMTEASFIHFYHIPEDIHIPFTALFRIYDSVIIIQLRTYVSQTCGGKDNFMATKCLHVPSTCSLRNPEEGADSFLLTQVFIDKSTALWIVYVYDQRSS